MNKLLIGLTSAVLMASIAAPALATGCFGPFCFPQTSNDVTVNNNSSASVKNDVVVVASTGDNEIEGGSSQRGCRGSSKGGVIITGDAYADGYVENTVNTNDTKIKAPCEDCNGDVTVNNYSTARVRNEVKVIADTGENEIEGGRHSSGGGFIMTGNAASYSTVVNVVNTNITRIRR